MDEFNDPGEGVADALDQLLRSLKDVRYLGRDASRCRNLAQRRLAKYRERDVDGDQESG